MMYLGKDPVGLATSIPVFSNLAKVEVGEYTPTTDTDPVNTPIQHSLGEPPDFIIYFSDHITSLSSDTYAYLYQGTMCKIYYSTGSEYHALVSVYVLQTKIGAETTQYIRGNIAETAIGTENIFHFPCTPNYNQRLKANLTYHYIIGKFKNVIKQQEVTSNANE